MGCTEPWVAIAVMVRHYTIPDVEYFLDHHFELGVCHMFMRIQGTSYLRLLLNQPKYHGKISPVKKRKNTYRAVFCSQCLLSLALCLSCSSFFLFLSFKIKKSCGSRNGLSLMMVIQAMNLKRFFLLLRILSLFP